MSVVVSVVIPVCSGSPRVVADTIESCLNQSFKDYEILLIQNNAQKDTVLVVESFAMKHGKKIRLVNEPKQGACSARNRGILEAKGEYIALLDDDDMMYPHRLEAQLTVAEKHPEAALIHSLRDLATSDNSWILRRGISDSPEFWRSLLFKPDSPLANVPTVLPSVMFFRKDTAIKAGLFDEYFNPQVAEESEFCLRMSELGKFVLVEDSLVRFRSNRDVDGVVRNKRGTYLRIRNTDRLYRVLRHRYGSKINGNTERAFKIMRAQWLRETSLILFPYRYGRFQAKYVLGRALKEGPFNLKTWKVLVRTCYPLALWPSALHFNEWIDAPLPEELSTQFLDNIFSCYPEDGQQNLPV